MANARETTATSGDQGNGIVAVPPQATRGGATIPITVVLLALLVASIAAFLMSSPPPASSQDDKLRTEGAGFSPVEHAVGDGGTPGFNSRLDAFRTWAKLAWTKLRQPNSEEPRYDAGGSPGASATHAAKESFEMGKETVEQTAATAARAAEGAVGMAKDKVKGVAAPSPDAEL